MGIDMDHSPGAWTSSPHAGADTCATQAYVNIDLGAPHSLSGVTIWHYYGNQRAYCSQKIALSMSGEFEGEETVVYDTGTCSGWCTFPITCEGGDSATALRATTALPRARRQPVCVGTDRGPACASLE